LADQEPRAWRFSSLFLGGFEASEHLNEDGLRLDQIAGTGHDVQVADDYRLCRRLGIAGVRESLRWVRNDRDGQLRLDEVRHMARLGREIGITQIWDVMHFGYPDGLDAGDPSFGDALVERIARFTEAAARAIRDETDAPLYLTPVNEISWAAWKAGEVGWMAPFWKGRGGEWKRILVRASLAAADAMWSVDPKATIVSVDPLVRNHVHPVVTDPVDRERIAEDVRRHNEDIVFEAFDLLAGRREPELGGSRRSLGIVGLNYYFGNQWLIGYPDTPRQAIELGEEGLIPLHVLLGEVEARYGGPVLLTETGAPMDLRPRWVAMLHEEARRALHAGIDLAGLCLYPMITTPDWEDRTAFLEAGVVDTWPLPDGTMTRFPQPLMIDAMRAAQRELDPEHVASTDIPAYPAEHLREGILVDLRDAAPYRNHMFGSRTVIAGDASTVQLLAFEPDGAIGTHRHFDTEHVLTVIEGEGDIFVSTRWFHVKAGQTLLIPAGAYHTIRNATRSNWLVQQVNAPKPWEPEHGGPRPPDVPPWPADEG
jgi:mannose-6-phosphate isomerase-like protein (cupin superfamily)